MQAWEDLELDPRRVSLFVISAGSAVFAVVLLVGEQLALGSVSLVLACLAGCTAAYLVFTAPRRAVRTSAFRQALEAPSLAASSNIYVKTTGSRSKTFILLRAEEPRLRSFLAEVRRGVLLGYDAASAASAARPEKRVFAESARTVVNSVIGVERTRVEEGGEELDGILNSSELEDETKLPVFVAVSFFLPIMLMLFAAMTKETGIAPIGALFVLEVLVLDLVLGASSSSVDWGRGERP